MINNTQCQMVGDADLNAQIGELYDVAELKRDGASELIREKEPARMTLKH